MAKKQAEEKFRYVYKSAITGRFVSHSYARRYPKSTIRMRVPVSLRLQK
jgi:hypothetical protein